MIKLGQKSSLRLVALKEFIMNLPTHTFRGVEVNDITDTNNHFILNVNMPWPQFEPNRCFETDQ